MSLRASASLPSSCSGAMYWNVPTIAPSAVSGAATVGGDRGRRAATRPAAPSRARPKSSSFAPARVSMTLPGLRSRWTIAARGARDRARRRSARRCAASRRAAARPRREALGERLALEQLHHQVVGVALAADVVERADVRVVERRDRAGLALEARAHLGRAARCGGSTLIATSRPSRVSRARYTSPMPPAPSGERIS